MQMIWLLGAAAPAKKVHFNLNGSELRGFPIKARSGQSSILYANPLAPKAVARFCLCPAVITGGANVPEAPVCQSGPFWCRFLPHIHSCHTYSGLTHSDRQTHTHRHAPTDISSHLVISLSASFPSSKGLVICVNGAGIDWQVGPCSRWQLLWTEYSTNNDRTWSTTYHHVEDKQY